MANSWQVYAQLPPYNPNYELKFFDDFDRLNLDTTWYNYFNWGNLDYTITALDPDGIKDDTVYTQAYMPTNDHNFIYDNAGSGKISLVTRKETPKYSGLVWDYYHLDTTSIVQHTLFSGLNSTGHSVGTFSFYVDSATYLVVEQDSIYTVDSLHVVRDSIHREFRHSTKEFEYTTAMLRSHNKYRYGYFEMRFHLPNLDPDSNNTGIGPNFWLWDHHDTIPWSEIDIFEIKDDSMFYNPGQYKHYHSAATHITPDASTEKIMKYKYFNQLNFCDTCYTKFSVLWDDKSIKYYVNGNNVWESDNFPDRMIAMPIIIGYAVPINLDDDNNHTPILPNPHTILPYSYDIDYVKAYQLKQYCNSDYVITSFNPDNFDYGLYKTISLGGSGSSSTIASGKVVPLMATDGITINGTFTVELGAEFSLETRPCLQQSLTNKGSQQETQTPPPDSFYETFFPSKNN